MMNANDLFNNTNNYCCQQYSINNSTKSVISPKKLSTNSEDHHNDQTTTSITAATDINVKNTVINDNNFYNVADENYLNIVKDRYMLTESECGNTTHFKCFDIHTKRLYLCRIIHEKCDKIRLAYFNLKMDLGNITTEMAYDDTINTTTINDDHKDMINSDRRDHDEDHHLVRPVHDIIPASLSSSYIIISTPGLNENLHSYIRNRRCLREDEAKPLFRQICKMVSACHRKGIILRDLKLRKFFFIDRYRKKLQYESLDGSVILNDPNEDHLSEKIGCPLYVAPEVISSTTFSGKVADVWSLGVILYAMLIGGYPFNDPAGQAQILFTKILLCQYYIPSQLSAEANCLIRSLLRKSPDERLEAEDILYHPWFSQSSYNGDYTEDQIVPELGIFDEEIEMGKIELT